MPLFDFACTACGHTEPDLRVRDRSSLVECSGCGHEMQRQIGVPQPAIFTTGGTGAGRSS